MPISAAGWTCSHELPGWPGALLPLHASEWLLAFGHRLLPHVGHTTKRMSSSVIGRHVVHQQLFPVAVIASSPAACAARRNAADHPPVDRCPRAALPRGSAAGCLGLCLPLGIGGRRRGAAGRPRLLRASRAGWSWRAVHHALDEDLRGFRVDGIAVGAQASHSGGSPMSQRECAGFNWPPLSIPAEEPVSISPVAVSRAGESDASCACLGS